MEISNGHIFSDGGQLPDLSMDSFNQKKRRCLPGINSSRVMQNRRWGGRREDDESYCDVKCSARPRVGSFGRSQGQWECIGIDSFR